MFQKNNTCLRVDVVSFTTKKTCFPLADVFRQKLYLQISSFLVTNCNFVFVRRICQRKRKHGYVHFRTQSCSRCNTRSRHVGLKTMLTVHKSTGKRNSLVTPKLNLQKYLEFFFCTNCSSKFTCNSRNEER